MNLEERLKFCKLCENKRFDFDQGLLCKLTNQKPAFDSSCPSYNENPYERKNYENSLFSDRIKTIGLTESNIYPTSNWLISLAQKYISDQFRIQRFYIKHYLVTPLILFLIPLFLGNSELEPMHRAVLTVILILLGILASFKNWKSFKNETEELAVLNDLGIKIGNDYTVDWSNVTLAYIKIDFTKLYLVFELLNRAEPIMLQLNGTIGARIILTLSEAYRRESHKRY